MALFHVNPATGEAGACSAQKGKCPFGSTDDHFTSAEAARSSYENSMASKIHAPVSKPRGDGRSTRGAWPDLELYRSRIGKYDEVFVHTQGKIAIIHDARGMEVFKNGKAAKTSGTPSDLRNGRGAWKLVKGSTEELMSTEDYNSAYENPENVAVPISSPMPVVDKKAIREAANKKAGFPANSQLNASKTGQLTQTHSTTADYYNPYPILAIGKRGNPHKDMANSPDGLTMWNYKDRDGNEHIATLEVWKGKTDTGRDAYKLVATGGDDVHTIGSTTVFQHDQSRQYIEGNWTMVGGLKTEIDGEAFGEVPDRSMPIYTFK
jgi:hypothetical protein